MTSKYTTAKSPRPGFIINNYQNWSDGNGTRLTIEGHKLPPPSKRITLRQKNIKILKATITYKHKKGDIEYDVTRINRIKSFGEVRLHTNNILYPGSYVIKLDYTGQLNEENIKGNPA